jgi:ferredoxin-NADP reductase
MTSTLAEAAAHTETGLGLEVACRESAAEGVLVLGLRHPDGEQLPAWQPGAHIDLLLKPGMARQFSLCGDPADRLTWRIGVLRETRGRGGSLYVHDKLGLGSVVRVRGPRNHFPLVPAPRYLFIAGGIGITPLLPMLAAADAARAPWTLVYGGRTRASMAFVPELLARYPGRVLVYPQDETGLLDLDALLGQPRPDTLVYCCGPEPLLAAAEARCSVWPDGSLRVERFAPRAGAGAPERTAFQVQLARSGLTLDVPADASILEVVETARVPVLSSCTEGTCGTCETAVLAGTPDHRDSVLTAAERSAAGVMMICVSRSATPRLVLDL